MESSERADYVDQPHGLGHAKLGQRFWVVWWAMLVAILAAFAGAMVYAVPRMSGWMEGIGGGAIVLVFTSLLIFHTMSPMRRLQKRGLEGKMRPAYRRYMWRFLPAMFGYALLLIGAVVYVNEMAPTGFAAWIAGLAPALPLLFAIRAVVLLPRDEDDEFLRDGIYQTYAWATGGALAICSVYGFLDLFSVVPHVQLWAVFPIWAVCLGFGQIVRARRFS
jgi:hypothetical protein